MKFERVFFCLAILLLAQSVNGGKTIMDTVNNLESLLDKRKSLYDELAKRTTNGTFIKHDDYMV